MNKGQLTAAKKVIAADANGVGDLVSEDGKTYCALGGLGKAAGLTDTQLRRAASRPSRYHGAPYASVARAIQKKFGINPWWVRSIYSTNDRHDSLRSRRAALKRLMDEIYEEDNA